MKIKVKRVYKQSQKPKVFIVPSWLGLFLQKAIKVFGLEPFETCRSWHYSLKNKYFCMQIFHLYLFIFTSINSSVKRGTFRLIVGGVKVDFAPLFCWYLSGLRFINVPCTLGITFFWPLQLVEMGYRLFRNIFFVQLNNVRFFTPPILRKIILAMGFAAHLRLQ